MKRVIQLRTLPGEPTDGSGKVSIHLFVPDPAGPFTEPHVLSPVVKDGVPQRQFEAKATRGRLACDPKKSAIPVTRKGVTTLTMRTDDYRAVTCSKCIASRDYQEQEAKTKGN